MTAIIATGSDTGRRRTTNEDRILCDSARGIFALVDGVGGESAGELAAETAVEILHSRLSRRTGDAGRRIREAITLANNRIFELAGQDPRRAGMSCVLTVAVVDDGQVTVGHVGDSRLYRLRPGEIRKITRDHSPVGAREDAGELSEVEAMRHPRRHEIYRDVGSERHGPDDEDWIDVDRVDFDPDAALLLCSDGLTDQVTTDEIRSVVEHNAGDPRAAVAELIARANAAGGRDNVSVMLIEGDGFAAVAGAGRPPAPDRQAAPAPAGAFHVAPQLAIAARVPSRWERWLESLRSPWALAAAAFLLGLVAALALRQPLAGLADRLGGAEPGASAVLRVGPEEGSFTSIATALAAARPGQVVEVAPGVYDGRVRLRDGVALVSRERRGAELRLSGPGTADFAVAVTADSVRGARIAGFRIAGGGGSPLEIGLRLTDSTVEVEDCEIAGARVAGVEISGAGRSTLRWSYVHDNPGAGIVVQGRASPLIASNLIHRNGTGPEAARPGIEILDAARPLLVDNRIEDNGAGGALTADGAGAEEIRRWNSFGGAAAEDAVRVEEVPAEPTEAEPAPETGE